LHSALSDVHRYNQGRAWDKQLSLQVYAHTDRDAEQLTDWLMACLDDPELAVPARTLLLYFQGPGLLQADEHPADTVPFPVVVLQNALTKMVSLPVEVSYTLPEVLDALDSDFRYARKEHLHYPLGHGLRSEAIHAAWHRGQTDFLERLRQEARLYLYALRSLLWQMRKRVKDHVFAWPPKFQLPAVANVRDPLLSRLAFFTRYESMARCLGAREGRAEPSPVQAQLGLMVELSATSDTEFEVLGDPVIELEADGFPSWLLVRDIAAGRRAQLEFNDYAYRNKPHGGKAVAERAVVGLTHISEDEQGVPHRLRVTYATPFLGNTPRRGERFQLHPRFTDFTSDPIIDFLEELDQEGTSLFHELLRSPLHAAAHCPLPGQVDVVAAAGEESLGFTTSQLAAYREIRVRKLLAVWGPPGTGKTHFLATAIIGLAHAHIRASRPFRVLVTAFTHAAIENLLEKIACRQKELLGIAQGLELAKVKGWRSSGAAPVEVVTENNLAGWLDGSQHAVVGATVYSCLNARKKTGMDFFDLVVVDEASQVRVAEAAVPAQLVASGGRLVLAGDDMQLPPIVQGEYPEPEPGGAALHRSVFELVRRRLPGDSPVVQKLLENYRMNDVLTSFPAGLVYGPGYRCADDEIAGRRARLAPGKSLSPFLSACLDPCYPLVALILEGAHALSENQVEAELVAEIVANLRARLLAADGQVYDDDAAFFRHGVFVVSPHRAQNRAIRRELHRLRAWHSRPMVDTVDKMQGQEVDVAIISYGVADPEHAMREAEFIYSMNRLNVSVTRARAKTIVCLPRPLLEAPPAVLEIAEAARGLAYMRGLLQALAQGGVVKEYPLSADVHVQALMAAKPLGRQGVSAGQP
jgi:hypothetical protein